MNMRRMPGALVRSGWAPIFPHTAPVAAAGSGEAGVAGEAGTSTGGTGGGGSGDGTPAPQGGSGDVGTTSGGVARPSQAEGSVRVGGLHAGGEGGPVATAADGTKTAGRGDLGTAAPEGTAGGDGTTGGLALPADWKVEDLPAPLQKMITDLRKEAGDNRAAKKTAEKTAADLDGRLKGFLDGFAKVMGLAGEDGDGKTTPPDPEALTRQLTDATAERRELRIENAVWKSAANRPSKANAAELLDSRDFLTRIKGLDPDAADFADSLGAAIDEAVKANPTRFAAASWTQPAAAPSGGEFTGGPGGSRDPESMSIDDFRAARKKSRST